MNKIRIGCVPHDCEKCKDAEALIIYLEARLKDIVADRKNKAETKRARLNVIECSAQAGLAFIQQGRLKQQSN